jgi:abortive infection bacteriophage resistance protein
LSAYFIPFKDAATGNFRPGTAFDQIVDLYKFDSDLRRLVLEALGSIEINVRAVITYHIAKDLGVFGYADSANFAPAFNHADFLNILRREEKRSTELFVEHYRTKYTSETELPVWMASHGLCRGNRGRAGSTNRLDLRREDEAWYISCKMKNPPI